MKATRLFLIATALLYVAMMIGHVVWFGPPWGNTRLLDIRLEGYSVRDVEAFLELIGESGRAAMFGPMQWLDALFPPMLAVSLIILFRATREPRGGVRVASYSILPLIYLAADLVENSLLSDFELSVDGGEVLIASLLTQLKFVALGLSLIPICVGAWAQRAARRAH